MSRKRTKIDFDDESSSHHTEVTFLLDLILFPNKRESIGMANDDKLLVIDDSMLSCDTKTNNNLCMLIAIYNSLRSIEKRIAFL
jgi:hypothetical protein